MGRATVKEDKMNRTNSTEPWKSPDGGKENYTIEFKLSIVEEAKEVDNNAQVARKHGISEASVRCWRKNEAKLKISDIKNEGVQNSEIYDEEDIPLAKRQKLSITPPVAASDNKN